MSKKVDYKILDCEKIDELYKNGESLISLSKKFSHSPKTIKKIFKYKRNKIKRNRYL